MTPSVKPRIVARMMPLTATSSVLVSPTIAAQKCDFDGS